EFGFDTPLPSVSHPNLVEEIERTREMFRKGLGSYSDSPHHMYHHSHLNHRQMEEEYESEEDSQMESEEEQEDPQMESEEEESVGGGGPPSVEVIPQIIDLSSPNPAQSTPPPANEEEEEVEQEMEEVAAVGQEEDETRQSDVENFDDFYIEWEREQNKENISPSNEEFRKRPFKKRLPWIEISPTTPLQSDPLLSSTVGETSPPLLQPSVDPTPPNISPVVSESFDAWILPTEPFPLPLEQEQLIDELLRFLPSNWETMEL
ncbi:unnamed protein product, partial [Cyprideis torosa]